VARTVGGGASAPSGPEALHRAKLRAAAGGRVKSNVEYFESLGEEERARLPPGVLRKPTRTLSGVAVVAVMTSPARCPHGRCTYCPGGVDSGSPQSYTGEEPSALRGAEFGFDAYAITRHRLEVLARLGHATSKVEVIVMGGTFPARPRAYREAVFRGLFDGLNGPRSPSLAEAQAANERAASRCVGLTVETRPDWCGGQVLPELLDGGVTRVELGVECLTDPVLASVGRAHGSSEVSAATREARDRGLKVGYHVMLGLPGMDPDRDLADLTRMFADPQFRPDMLKVYPTLVLPGTGLFEDWKAGRYRPYDTATAAGVLARMKRIVPPWVRIQRIQRDIPARLIADGVRTSNLRQVALRTLAESGGRCRCLRCREPGRLGPADPARLVEIERSYPASGGEERFLSLEDPETDTVAGFLRLRFPSGATEGGLDAPVIRELKVLGAEVAIGQRPEGPDRLQHRGLGRALVARAEALARGAGHDRLYVLSAVGTREYYRALGYERAGPHMAKRLFA
jgi:elongator complex protein 3